jgi:type III restriction enzyme
MDRIAQMISNRLSLREPQKVSLDRLTTVLESLPLKKDLDLQPELEKIKSQFPTCTDFERNFPSLCFALATGVGKTRLMGAFITWLHLEKGINNFFVLAPNLTIYNKLIKDFSDPGYHKYVFKGIGEFSQDPPRVITGDNYTQAGQGKLFLKGISINVFNISKINAETRMGAEPRIKRLSEYIGESYFNYLSNLEDLVLLMDESHHYRADRGMQVINELNPVLGLELTATPQVEKGNANPVKFRNVIYEYSLAQAIEDGFVKEPAVATRKDFDPSRLSAQEIDELKIGDGIRIHEETKNGIELYAKNNNAGPVKPFVLIVAKDTEHARVLRAMIQSETFFNGRYRDKVMEIHSNQKGEEREENINQLLSLEDPKNPIEIVIHVNMLKEGWDVTNLYTIIPLRTAVSTTLREQTIGRGLRLSYGQRTQDKSVDTLTIVAHDKFQEIIDAANRPDSIIRMKNIIEIDPMELQQGKEIVASVPRWEQAFLRREQEIREIKDAGKRVEALQRLSVERELVNIFPTLNNEIKSVQELTTRETQNLVITKYKEKLWSSPQKDFLTEKKLEMAEAAVSSLSLGYASNMIEIPRIILRQSEEMVSGFHDFDLDTRTLILFQPVGEEILIKRLREQDDAVSYIDARGMVSSEKLENIIVDELIRFPEIDYDSQADLLFKLSGQAIAKFRNFLKSEDEVANVVQYHKRDIAMFIHSEMESHFYCESPGYEDVTVQPFVELLNHNFSKYTSDTLHLYTDTIDPVSAIPGKVFVGFKKACHDKYKFDSKTEKDFSIIVENDGSVMRWLRPAEGQFQIYWAHNSKKYHPDFVVETADAIFMVETKMQREMNTNEVDEKTRAALDYCGRATRFNMEHGKKPWRYVLIPHEAVQLNMSFNRLVSKYEKKNNTGEK